MEGKWIERGDSSGTARANEWKGKGNGTSGAAESAPEAVQGVPAARGEAMLCSAG